jgi:anti-sigma regulatory factor (Ser/Thr protein kinase)
MCPTSAVLPAPIPTQLADFSLSFPPQPQWVHASREAVRAALAPVVSADADLTDLADLAALLTSELVTNAVVASADSLTPAPIAVHGEWTPTHTLRILVHDQAPGTPCPPDDLPPPEEEHGRGLLLITLYATDWGVCHHIPGPGKVVWFTLGGKP